VSSTSAERRPATPSRSSSPSRWPARSATFPLATSRTRSAGELLFADSVTFSGSSASAVEVASAARLAVYLLVNPIPYSVRAAAGTALDIRDTSSVQNTNLNIYAGPIQLDGDIRATGFANTLQSLRGPVSGPGGLTAASGELLLANPANDYSGTTVVSNGVLRPLTPAALSPASALTVRNGGTLRLLSAPTAAEGWTDADIAGVLTPSVFLDLTATLGIDTSLRDVSLTAPLAGFTHGLAKYGTGTLGYLVSGPTESGPLAVREGTLNLGPASALTLPAPAAISVSPSLGRTGFLNLPGGASLATEDLGQGVSQPALYAGTTGRGVVTLTNTASASVGRLDVGRETGSAGIIRLAAGTRLHSRSGTGNTGLVGINNGSYGCIQNDGGTVTNNGDVVFGLAAGSCGIYRQTAGAFATAGGTVAPAGTQGGYYGGLTYIGRSGTGHAYISGGSFVQHGGNQIHMGSRDTVNGGLAVLTVDGDASVSADRIDCCANNPDSRVLINLLGGTLSLRYIWRSAQAGSAAAVNFNGGTFRVPNNPATLFQGGASCLIYPGGGTIDTAGLYAGFIWNRSSTNETWSFAESIDDNVMLVLDGETLINDGRWDGTTVATRTVAPGPHAIELRVYNNTGGGGPAAKDGWTTTDWGFGVDRLGRGLKDTACYEPLIDPGDGSFLTTGPVEGDPFQDVPVDIAPGAALDLSGFSHRIQLITGGGTVTNGALASGSALSPGGDDATGTLTLSGVALGDAVYRATLRDAGADVLAFTQPADLSALTIVPSDAFSLAPGGRDYIIATAPAFTGNRPALSGFPSHWKVLIWGGELHLTAIGGTLFSIQ